MERGRRSAWDLTRLVTRITRYRGARREIPMETRSDVLRTSCELAPISKNRTEEIAEVLR